MTTQQSLPLIEPDLFGFTTCDNDHNCKTGPFPIGQVFAIAKKTNGSDHVFHFCGETCANHFHLERLRTGL